MNQKETLIPYIKQQVEQGTSAEIIKQQLLAQGWETAVVDDAMRSVQPETHETAPSQLPPEPQQATTAPQVITSQPMNPLSQAVTAQPVAHQNFGIREAFSDAVKAIKVNLAGLTILSIVGIVVPFIFFWLLMILLIVTGLGGLFFGLTLGSLLFFDQIALAPFLIMLELLVVFLVSIVLASLVSGFTLALIGLAANDGAEGKKSNIKNTLRAGVVRTPRMLIATLLYTAIITSPLFLTFIVAIIFGFAVPSLAFIVMLLAMVAAIVMIFLALKFALLPFVALFEPDVSIKQLLTRTKQLMAGGGMWFVFVLGLTILLISIILSVFQPDPKDPSILGSLISIIVSMAIGTLYVTLMVVFYRNRKALKG